MGAGTSVQEAAIFDEGRRGGPGAETRDTAQKLEGEIVALFKLNLRILHSSGFKRGEYSCGKLVILELFVNSSLSEGRRK